MRYTHGCKPRNPYNMIIQENHVADRANLIIPYLGTNYPVEKVEDTVHTTNHQMRKYLAKEENHHVNDDNAIAFNIGEDLAKTVWSDSIKNA